MKRPPSEPLRPVPLAFFRLVMAASISVDEAAERYGRSKRTIRLWCAEATMGCRVAGGGYRVSLPLLELYAAGSRRDVITFMDGVRPSKNVREAFEYHGAAKALDGYVCRIL